MFHKTSGVGFDFCLKQCYINKSITSRQSRGMCGSCIRKRQKNCKTDPQKQKSPHRAFSVGAGFMGIGVPLMQLRQGTSSIFISARKSNAESHNRELLSATNNQNHQLSWWYALCLEGIFAGSPIRALNEIFIRIKFTGYC
jgi:hypothetical protein